MRNDATDGRKYVFICGLQRSGTSGTRSQHCEAGKLHRFKNTDKPMDEGRFLQDVYPFDGKFGEAGSFGFDARAHRTETSTLLTPGKYRQAAGKLARSLGRQQEYLR